MKRESSLIGRRAYIQDKDSIYDGEWGTIVDVDKHFHVAIANNKKSIPIFDRKQLYIPRRIRDTSWKVLY